MARLWREFTGWSPIWRAAFVFIMLAHGSLVAALAYRASTGEPMTCLLIPRSAVLCR